MLRPLQLILFCIFSFMASTSSAENLDGLWMDTSDHSTIDIVKNGQTILGVVTDMGNATDIDKAQIHVGDVILRGEVNGRGVITAKRKARFPSLELERICDDTKKNLNGYLYLENDGSTHGNMLKGKFTYILVNSNDCSVKEKVITEVSYVRISGVRNIGECPVPYPLPPDQYGEDARENLRRLIDVSLDKAQGYVFDKLVESIYESEKEVVTDATRLAGLEFDILNKQIKLSLAADKLYNDMTKTPGLWIDFVRMHFDRTVYNLSSKDWNKLVQTLQNKKENPDFKLDLSNTCFSSIKSAEGRRDYAVTFYHLTKKQCEDESLLLHVFSSRLVNGTTQGICYGEEGLFPFQDDNGDNSVTYICSSVGRLPCAPQDK